MKKKLSYLEQREWEQIESRILEAEAELGAVSGGASGSAGRLRRGQLQQTYERVQAAQAQVDRDVFAVGGVGG